MLILKRTETVCTERFTLSLSQQCQQKTYIFVYNWKYYINIRYHNGHDKRFNNVFRADGGVRGGHHRRGAAAAGDGGAARRRARRARGLMKIYTMVRCNVVVTIVILFIDFTIY